mmetsp:Transcript_13110/g.24137  ORF Transcript_13110/g.24137 Transcript_13110/m.24137 type:complete len:395 (-) Transcript_13110:108-1292(-)
MGCCGSQSETDVINETKKDGQRFSKVYKLGNIIGRGSFSKVYEATEITDPAKRWAVKMVPVLVGKVDPAVELRQSVTRISKRLEDPNIDPWERECFENALSKMQKDADNATSATPYEKIKQEVQFMKDCQHPHIMAAQAVFESPKCVCIVLVRCYGDLTQHVEMRGAPISDEVEISRLIRHLLSAVEFLHSKWILHRDIKPPNCALTSEHVLGASLLLADFGLAIEMPHDTEFLPLSKGGSICGTAAYLSPEAITGKVGKAADIWAVGCVLYELIMCQEFATHYLIFCKAKEGQLFSAESQQHFQDAFLQALRGAKSNPQLVKESLEASELAIDTWRQRVGPPSSKVVACLQKLLNVKLQDRPTASSALLLEFLDLARDVSQALQPLGKQQNQM